MFAVIFRGVINRTDDRYRVEIERMKHLALVSYGCTGFFDMVQECRVMAVSYWPDMAAMRAWKDDPAHPLSQNSDSESWYRSYTIQIVAIKREYSFNQSSRMAFLETLDGIGI